MVTSHHPRFSCPLLMFTAAARMFSLFQSLLVVCMVLAKGLNGLPSDPCLNPYGGSSPCGPSALCAADPTSALGYTCKSIASSCPGGCSPGEICQGVTCVCSDGFYRPHSQSPCVPTNQDLQIDTLPDGKTQFHYVTR
jgi:hypothetical protein